jgi:predicted alpha-1,2-mannosidase
MYHTLQAPSTYSEVDGNYLGFDMQTHSLDNDDDLQLSDMSIWDTHRSWNPLMTLLQPDIATAVARSLVRMTNEGGAIPRWPLAHGYTACMIGNHAGSIVLDTWIKGLQNFDVETLFVALNRTATQITPAVVAGRADLKDYLESGYCVSDEGSPSSKWAAACTLAYAYDDWALSALAGVLNKSQDVVDLFSGRSQSYRNIFDNSTGYFCPRARNGSFACPAEFAPTSMEARGEFGGDKVGGYAEGDGAQWRWFVPGDVTGLIELLG